MNAVKIIQDAIKSNNLPPLPQSLVDAVRQHKRIDVESRPHNGSLIASLLIGHAMSDDNLVTAVTDTEYDVREGTCAANRIDEFDCSVFIVQAHFLPKPELLKSVRRPCKLVVANTVPKTTPMDTLAPNTVVCATHNNDDNNYLQFMFVNVAGECEIVEYSLDKIQQLFNVAVA